MNTILPLRDTCFVRKMRSIARAIESGLLWIIHGKGTGRLRQGVHEFLKRHSQVDKFELAEQKEGGSE